MGRKRKSGLQLAHSVFGAGEVIRRVATDTGDALLVRFGDKDRIVLVDSPGWTNPQDAVDAHKHAPEPSMPQPKPRKPIRVRRPAVEIPELGELAEVE